VRLHRGVRDENSTWHTAQLPIWQLLDDVAFGLSFRAVAAKEALNSDAEEIRFHCKLTLS